MKIFSKIAQNARAHDRIAGRYESEHLEIFNAVEQARLGAKLAEAAEHIRAGAEERAALDLGCGSGNLTSHLLRLGFRVTAADISDRFLELVRGKFGGNPRLTTARINGRDLALFPDNSFDLSAAYSVLHHAPDYRGIVREMGRVTKPGGVIYIDHESSPAYWGPRPEYDAFIAEASPPRAAPPASRFLKLSTYLGKLRLLIDPRYIAEGDIHVWPDDHIEWDVVSGILAAAGFEPLFSEDYLLFRQGYPPAVYDRYKFKCSDIRVFAARKKTEAGPLGTGR